jgi:RNA polymerase sigma-70 factor (ECF subfamily)
MPTEPTDEQLIAEFAKGDVSCLGELARRYEGSLFGLARGLLSGREDLARDAVQEAWIRVIKYGRHFEGRSCVRTWLYRIVVNKCHDARAAARREAHADRNGSVHAGQEPAPSTFDDAELTRLLDAIPDSARMILLLCHHRGLTNEQAADVLGIPVGTLKSRQHAAMQQLREIAAKEARP